jgi:hypothetical protein
MSFNAFGSTPPQTQLPPTPYEQIAKLIAPDGQANDLFGYSVAVDGSTIVVGKGDAQLNTAFVFENNSGTVTEVAELTPSDGMPGDRFGIQVAISGNTIVVNASSHRNTDPLTYGTEYVYVEPTGGWSNMTETAELTLAQVGADIGISMATNGNTVVAINHNNGTAVVWVEPSGGWVSSSKPNAELTESTGQALANVAISGNTIVAGSPSAYGYGATYVYVKPANGWSKIGITETARLVGTVAQGGGYGVAISGNTVASIGNGNVFIFVKPAGGWVNANQTATITASYFPYSLALSANTMVLGNPTQLVGVNPSQGAAFVYIKPSGGWKNTSTANAELVASDGNILDQLGWSVAVSGSTVVAGAPYATIGSNTWQGAAYVFALH